MGAHAAEAAGESIAWSNPLLTIKISQDNRTRFLAYNLFVIKNQPCGGSLIMSGHNAGVNIDTLLKKIEKKDLRLVQNILLLNSLDAKSNLQACNELVELGYPTAEQLSLN